MWIYSANARAMSKYETEHNHLSPPARQELFKQFNQNLFKCFYLLRLVLNWCETHSGKHGTSLRKAKVTQASCSLKKTLTGLSQNLKPNIRPKWILKYLSFHTEMCLWNINAWMRKKKIFRTQMTRQQLINVLPNRFLLTSWLPHQRYFK